MTVKATPKPVPVVAKACSDLSTFSISGRGEGWLGSSRAVIHLQPTAIPYAANAGSLNLTWCGTLWRNLTRGIVAVEAGDANNWNSAAVGVVSTGAQPPNEITVLFDESTVTFRMPAEATLADLAARVTEEGGLQRRRMRAVTIKLGAPRIEPD